MQKKLFLLLLLVVCIALSGCALVVKDPARDAQQVIIDVNGETVDKQTVSQMVTNYKNNMLNYYYQLYSMYGLPFNESSVDLSTAEQDTINQEVERLVLKQKFAALPELALTAEDEAAVKTAAEEDYNRILDQVKSLYLSDSELEGDELTAAAQARALELDPHYNLDYFMNLAREDKMVEKLREYAIKDVAVTEDEIKAAYDTRVADAKTSYESDKSAFGTAVNNGETVYTRPAGYRYVKQILVGFPEDLNTALTAANSAKTTAQTALGNATTALADNAEALAAEGITDEEKAELEAKSAELQAALEAAQADFDEKSAAADKAKEDAFAAIQPTVDEVMAKIAAGEDFDALMEQYNTDPGMQREPGKTNGYAVCEGFTPFETAFVDAAMALKNIGDVSEPVKSDSYGYYIIRYQSDIAEGDVALDEVRSVVEPEVLADKQDTTYDAAVEQWKSEAKIKTYIERLSN